MTDLATSALPVDPMRPSTWDAVVGQERLKNRIQIAAEYAATASAPMPHVLLTGPPGVGKTTIAGLIAKTVGGELIVSTRALTARQATEQIVMADCGPATPPTVWLADEIHGWNRKAQEVLLPIIEDGFYDAGWGPEPCPWLTVVLATTDRGKVIQPLRDRITIDPKFDDYTDDHMTAIVAGMAARNGLTIGPDVAQALGRASGGIPRRARTLVTTALHLAGTGRPADVDAILYQARVTRDGLTARHLDVLRELRRLGSVGERALADQCGIAVDELHTLEHELVAREFMYRGRGGRQLTGRGNQALLANPDL